VRLRFMLLGAMLLALPANGQAIYRCEVNGKTTFSDKPCNGSSQAIDPAANKPTVAQPKPDSPDPMSGYATPHGTWRGQAQYQAKVGTELVEQAHAVVPVVLSIGIDGKVTGGSPDNGCRLLGIAAPGVIKTMLNLDVTLSQCRYAEFNRRYGGFISIYAKDKTAQLNLNAHVIRAGIPPRFFDMKGTLRR
jgi:hypothetical protein